MVSDTVRRAWYLFWSTIFAALAVFLAYHLGTTPLADIPRQVKVNVAFIGVVATFIIFALQHAGRYWERYRTVKRGMEQHG